MYGHRLHDEEDLNWNQDDVYINYSSDWTNYPLNKDIITKEMVEGSGKWLEKIIGTENLETNDEELPELAAVDITKAQGIQKNVIDFVSNNLDEDKFSSMFLCG